MIIDYSQYSKFNFCPWAWYENYVNQRSKPRIGQRRDPLCLGSLVHNGLDNFAKTGKPTIDEATVLENSPTPETYQLAILLVQGYLKRYPAEQWPVERAEQPLRFPLWNPDYSVPKENVLEGLAKLDGYFYVPEDTTIESGLEGYTLTLTRGWWAKEYKTKAASRDRAEWIKEWQTKRQADFQMLALQEYLRTAVTKEGDPLQQEMNINVQGVLVCVLEKPHEYIPKRKCAGCKNSYELMAFIPKAEGFMCPVCGVVQKLNPYVPKVPKEPDYFRITVTRSAEQLEIAKREILHVAEEMEMMRSGGMSTALPNRDACVNNVHHRECEYHAPHTYGGSTGDPGMGYVTIEATKYMGVVV